MRKAFVFLALLSLACARMEMQAPEGIGGDPLAFGVDPGGGQVGSLDVNVPATTVENGDVTALSVTGGSGFYQWATDDPAIGVVFPASGTSTTFTATGVGYVTITVTDAADNAGTVVLTVPGIAGQATWTNNIRDDVVVGIWNAGDSTSLPPVASMTINNRRHNAPFAFDTVNHGLVDGESYDIYVLVDVDDSGAFPNASTGDLYAEASGVDVTTAGLDIELEIQ